MTVLDAQYPLSDYEDYERRSSRTALYLAASLICATLLGPIFLLAPLPPIRIDDYLILIVFIFSIHQNNKLGRRYFVGTLLVGVALWLGFALAQAIGMLIGYEKEGYIWVVQDVYTPIRYVRSMVAFMAVGTLRIRREHWMPLLYVIAAIAIIQSLLCALQTYGPTAISAFFAKYYGAEQAQRMVATRGTLGRAMGTLGNPNEVGAVLSICCGTLLVLGMFHYRNLVRLIGWAVLIASALVILFLAQSRTNILGAIMAAVVVLLLSVLVPRGRWLPIVLLIGVLIMTPMAAQMIPPGQLPERVDNMIEKIRFGGFWQGIGETIEARMNMWGYLTQRVADADSYAFGIGQSKVEKIYADNGFVLAYMSSGFVGLAFYIGLYALMAVTLLRALARSRHSLLGYPTLALIGALVAMLVYEMTAHIIPSTRLGPLGAVLMGLALTVKRAEEDDLPQMEFDPDETAPEAREDEQADGVA